MREGEEGDPNGRFYYPFLSSLLLQSNLYFKNWLIFSFAFRRGSTFNCS